MAASRARWRGRSEKSVAKLSIRNDPGCRKTRREVKRRMAAIYADYEARQIKFDARSIAKAATSKG